MQPTVSPWAWVSSWDRRARTRAAGEYARTRDRAAPRNREHDKYAFYGLRKDSRHFIRLDPLAKGLLLNRQWAPTSAPVTWRVDRFHDTEPWAVPDIKSIPGYRPYEPVSIVLPAGGAAGAAGAGGATGAGAGALGGGSHGWSHAARGWAAGAVVLALLVLLVRAAENCLHKKLFKAIYMHTNVGAAELQQDVLRGHYRLQGVRRQESDEWSTPNVMATSLQHTFEIGPLPRVSECEESGPRSSDLPPPYSECSPPLPSHKYMSEEPPPPYSACYVSYNVPKNGEPEVHIRRQNLAVERPHSSTDIDNAQNDLIENGLRADSVAMTTGSIDSEDVGRTELVFDNGRIVERLSLDLSSSHETGVANNNSAVEDTRQADNAERVVYIDETTEHPPPGRALLV